MSSETTKHNRDKTARELASQLSIQFSTEDETNNASLEIHLRVPKDCVVALIQIQPAFVGPVPLRSELLRYLRRRGKPI